MVCTVPKRFAVPAVAACGLTLLVFGCGQAPSFVDEESNRVDGDAKAEAPEDPTVGSNGEGPGGTPEGSGGKSSTTGKTPPTGKGSGGGPNGGMSPEEAEKLMPGERGNGWEPDWTDGKEGGGEEGEDNPKGPNEMPEIPEAEDDDLAALHRCLSQWRNHPFKGKVENYHRLSASVTVGGIGNAVRDTERTDEPFLFLIDAGVNVGGAPTYELMNPNGYYCMKVNVNVGTDFNIDLHCNARLADSRVNVNVGSNQNDATSGVGVHVLSSVRVNTVSPEGDRCLR